MHSVCPLSFMNVPEAHMAHVACPVAGCTVPGLHRVWSEASVEQNEPAGQAVHCSLLRRPGVLLKLPSKQGIAAVAPSSQKAVGGQPKHAV